MAKALLSLPGVSSRSDLHGTACDEIPPHQDLFREGFAPEEEQAASGCTAHFQLPTMGTEIVEAVDGQGLAEDRCVAMGEEEAVLEVRPQRHGEAGTGMYSEIDTDGRTKGKAWGFRA